MFNPLHPPDALDQLEPENHLGPVDPTTVPKTGPKVLTADERRQRNAREEMPPLGSMVMIPDFEKVAEKVLSETAWAYYKSACEFSSAITSNGLTQCSRYGRKCVHTSCRSKDALTFPSCG